MAKRMSDDEIMDFTYNKLFGDLDRIESDGLFKEKEDEEKLEGSDKAKEEGKAGLEGISLTIKPIMKGAAESGRPPEGGEPEGENEENEDKDKLRGIGRMSPLMAQLHGNR